MKKTIKCIFEIVDMYDQEDLDDVIEEMYFASTINDLRLKVSDCDCLGLRLIDIEKLNY